MTTHPQACSNKPDRQYPLLPPHQECRQCGANSLPWFQPECGVIWQACGKSYDLPDCTAHSGIHVACDPCVKAGPSESHGCPPFYWEPTPVMSWEPSHMSKCCRHVSCAAPNHTKEPQWANQLKQKHLQNQTQKTPTLQQKAHANHTNHITRILNQWREQSELIKSDLNNNMSKTQANSQGGVNLEPLHTYITPQSTTPNKPSLAHKTTIPLQQNPTTKRTSNQYLSSVASGGFTQLTLLTENLIPEQGNKQNPTTTNPNSKQPTQNPNVGKTIQGRCHALEKTHTSKQLQTKLGHNGRPQGQKSGPKGLPSQHQTDVPMGQTPLRNKYKHGGWQKRKWDFPCSQPQYKPIGN